MACCFLLAGHALSEAAELKVIGPCSPEPVFVRQFRPAGAGVTAGMITEAVFKEAGVPYECGPDGVTAIMGWSSGAQAMEPLPGGGLRVYGWCYAVDGSTPAVAASEFPLAPDTAELTWFYAYSELGPGGWGGILHSGLDRKARAILRGRPGNWHWRGERLLNGKRKLLSLPDHRPQ